MTRTRRVHTARMNLDRAAWRRVFGGIDAYQPVV